MTKYAPLQQIKVGLAKVNYDWCWELDLELLVTSYRRGNSVKVAAPVEAALGQPEGYLHTFMVPPSGFPDFSLHLLFSLCHGREVHTTAPIPGQLLLPTHRSRSAHLTTSSSIACTTKKGFLYP